MGEGRRTRGQSGTSNVQGAMEQPESPEVNYAEMVSFADQEVRRLRHAEHARAVYGNVQGVQQAVLKLRHEQTRLEPQVVTLREAVAAGEASVVAITATLETMKGAMEEAKAAEVAAIQAAGAEVRAVIDRENAEAEAQGEAKLAELQAQYLRKADERDILARECQRLDKIAKGLRAQLNAAAATGG